MDENPYFHPIGLSLIASVLRKDHEITILDLNAKRGIPVSLDGDYDLIGISGLITTYKFLVDFVPILRQRHSCPIVIGGGGITSAPEVYMENLKPDFGVIGEGEHTIVELIDAIEGRRSFESVDGIITKAFKTNPRAVERDLNSFPEQAFDLFDMETYVGTTRHLPRDAAILATRGCPHACTFCYHIFGRSFRYRDPKKVVDEMETLMNKYGAESFLFGDECLTAHKKNLLALCKEIVDRGINTQWACYSRVDTIDEEMVIAMKEAGCKVVGYGLEHGSQKILDEMNKGVTIQKMRETFLMTKKHISASGTFIFGMPGENDNSLFEYLKFINSVGLGRVMFHLSPYPGTKIFEDNKEKILEKFGSLHNFFLALDDAKKFVINLTKWDDETYFKKKNLADSVARHMAFVRAGHKKNKVLVAEYFVKGSLNDLGR
jgi:radical SAM superfamily enzyme YgiQ (UPF0313 family)